MAHNITEADKVKRLTMTTIFLLLLSAPPPHSLDLSPPNFFLWWFLKSRLFAKKPRTITELKE